jgi:branched-chain amino acid transport system substrate-binding protein
MLASVVLRRVLATATASLAVVSAACSGGSKPAASTSTLPPTTSTTAGPRGNVNGVLRVGVLLPQTGPAASIGMPSLEGVRLAAKEVNDAGGVLGHPLEIVVRDEGTDRATTADRLGQLLDENVDAIIGPASSKSLLALADRIVAAGVLTCSPTATTSALSALNTKHLIFRTMPADVEEASALSRAFSPTGRGSAAILYPDDSYGEHMRDALRSRLSETGVKVTAASSYDNAASDATDAVSTVLASQPEAVFVVGVADPGGLVVSALRARETDASHPAIFVTSGMRRADLYQKVPPGRPKLVFGIVGVSPASSVGSNDWFSNDFKQFAPNSPVDYAAYAFDCLNLIALSTDAANTDEPAAIAAQMETTSRGGAVCHTYADCLGLASQRRNIDYEGASGPVDLQASGDVESGWFDVFTFDEAGRDTSTHQIRS